MNGSEQQIYDAVVDNGKSIVSLKVRQEERHIENTKKFDTLFSKFNELQNHRSKCPLDKVDSISKNVDRLYLWIWGIVVIVVGSAIKVMLL